MTNDRDLDRQVHSWLAEPPSGPPDRDAVYARVSDERYDTLVREARDAQYASSASKRSA